MVHIGNNTPQTSQVPDLPTRISYLRVFADAIVRVVLRSALRSTHHVIRMVCRCHNWHPEPLTGLTEEGIPATQRDNLRSPY